MIAAVEAAMRGKASDIDVKAMIFVVVTVRDGVITRMDEYVERADALEAVGTVGVAGRSPRHGRRWRARRPESGRPSYAVCARRSSHLRWLPCS